MQRRQLLKSMLALGITSAIPLPKLAYSQEQQNLINIKQLFNQALSKNPSLLGFTNIERDFASQTLTVEGKLPNDLVGSFFRNGPAKHERGDIRFRHLFEGDGMIQRFDIFDNQIVHQGKFIHTPKFVKEQQRKQFIYSGPDTKIPNSLPVITNDSVNTANTNIIPVGEDLWALWEAGSASQLDGKTLEFKQQVDLGANSRFGQSLKGLPFSAHPKIDPNGDIWNFGLNANGAIVLYHLAASGQVKNVGLINSQYRGGMLHDFLITDKHILLILPSLSKNKHIEGYFAGIQFDNKLPMQVLVIDKNTLSQKRSYELPSGFAFHFGNAWEAQDGTISFDASLYPNVDVLHELSNVMQGKQRANDGRSQTAFFTLKPNGSIEQQNFTANSEFPRVCGHLTGLRNRYLYHLSAHANSLWSDSLICLDTYNGNEQRYQYGDDYLVEEHIPVCPRGIEGTGYIIGTALHVPSKRSCLNIFSAADIGAGPIARAWLPYHLPLGFHGNFKAAS